MSNSKKNWISIGLFMTTILVNALGALGYLNGLTQKDISDRYMTLITPAPSTFSIWSVIYCLLILSLVYMVIKKDDLYVQRVIEQISVLFWISCLMNIGWIVSFAYVQLEISVVLIGGLLFSLILICLKLLSLKQDKRFLFALTFGLYSGWLFIATVVNIAATLVKRQWNGFGISDEIWAIIILIVAGLLVVLVQWIIHNAVFSLPVAWAYWGIYQQLTTTEVFSGSYPFVAWTALIGMVVLLSSSALQFYWHRFGILPRSRES